MHFKRFELPPTISEGERNVTLHRYASSLWGRSEHIEPDALRELVHEANRARCATPLSDAEVDQICGSVMERPEGPSPAYRERAEANAAAWGEQAHQADADCIPDADDVSIGEDFAKKHADRLRAVHEGDKVRWYAYDGKRWSTDGKPIAAALLTRYVKALVAAATRNLSDADDEEEEKELKKLLTRYRSYLSAPKRRNLLNDVANRPEICAGPEDFDANTNVLNVQNGTIEFHPFKFRAHDPADLCTRIAGCDYDPDASQAAWTKFLSETFAGPTADVPDFLKVSMGLALAGDTSPERFFCFYGEPRAGKSTTAQALSAALGEYAHTSSAATFAVSNRSAQGPSADYIAIGTARLLFINEWPKEKRLDAAFLKSVTGNDPITARAVFGSDERNIQAHATICMNTNYLPRTDDTTVFTSRRAAVIPFTHPLPPENQDRGLKRTLLSPDNLSGVLNWALDGWRIYEGTGTIPAVPESCLQAIAEYSLASDTVARFIDERCDVGADKAEDGPGLYAEYVTYCNKGGEKAESAQAFYRELKHKGHTNSRATIHGKQTKVVRGLSLNSHYPAF